jgi:hypothetical protein
MSEFIEYITSIQSLTTLGLLISIIGLAYGMMEYLNRSSENKITKKRLRAEILYGDGRISGDFYENFKRISQDDVVQRLVAIENKLEVIENYNLDFQADEKAKVIDDIKKSIVTQSSDSILRELINKIEVSNFEKILTLDMEKSINRLKSEKNSLFIRGNFNLVIGVIMSIVGGFLAYQFIERLPASNSSFELISYSLPRFSLSLLIGLLVFFFLNLYRKSMDDIKYYQNEITNLESKYLSLNLANQMKNHKTIGMVIENLMQTERNFVLEKDQSTIELEKERINSNNSSNVIDMLKEIINSRK